MTAFRPGASPPPVLIAIRFTRPTSGGSASPPDRDAGLEALGAVIGAVGTGDRPRDAAHPGEDVVRPEQAERDIEPGREDPARALLGAVHLLARLHAEVGARPDPVDRPDRDRADEAE